MLRRMPFVITALGIVLTVFSPPSTHATVARSTVPFDEMLGRSDLVALGTIGIAQGTAVVERSGHRMVYTKHEFIIEDVLSDNTEPGEAAVPRSVTVLTEGGGWYQAGHPYFTTTGAVQVAEGERLVACLRRFSTGYKFTGFVNGKYLVLKGYRGENTVNIPTRRVDLIRAVVSDPRVFGGVQTGDYTEAGLSLDELRRFIQGLKAIPPPQDYKRAPGRAVSTGR